MIRRILVMAAACALFSGACMALAGKAREGYPLMPAVDPMGREEVEACLRASGIHVERFAGEVPFAHALRVEVEARRDGEPARRLLDGARLTGAAGLHRLLVLGRPGPGGLKLSALYIGPGGEGDGAVEVEEPIPLGDAAAIRWERPRDGTLTLGRRVEICRLSGGQQTVVVFVTLDRQ